MSLEFFLRSEMFHTKVVQKIKTHTSCSVTFSLNFCCLRDNVQQYGTARQVTDDKIQVGQRVSVHLMITIQTVTSNVRSVPSQSSEIQLNLTALAADRQGQGDTRLTLTPSVIPNSNYVITVSDRNSLKYFCVFL
jgi:hypothetical protein